MSTIDQPVAQPVPAGAKPKKSRARRWIVLAVLAAAAVGLFLIPGGAAREMEVAEEFEQHPLISIPKLGPLDFSITKAVVYLWISVGVLVLLALIVARVVRAVPGRFQLMLEGVYDLARDGIASVINVDRARWFPYIAAVFVFVLINNLIGLIPLPFGEHHQLSFYGATANLSVTAALALCTFVFTHFAGVQKKGVRKYFGGMVVKSAPPVLRQMLFGLHLISEIFRLVSLAVRLFANMLGGHAILAVFFAMALVFQNYLLGALLQGASVLIYLFEIFVAFIQAFIFAILSAIYIGGALEEGH